eukprot:CAMPEP_0114282436 /NCGR_PEP_ID=MMETSP0059-20121206/3560_1 /TAXON_ID=36894 /ORGANISM="Pyramimonas parkeae, Strain CCMP726" /LENGTH=329 /DNA_ID=CAMNT_0001403083 /DNA_START=72 /DNA_END=1061 /DNA_ORIENTATION=+
MASAGFRSAVSLKFRHGTGLKTQLRSSNANVLPMDPRPSGIARRAHFACRAEVGVLGKLGRVIREKAQADIDRVFKGTSKTREKLSVVDELFAYWKLDESENLLEDLEDALIAADFGPASTVKVVDVIREQVENGKLTTGPEIRVALKAALVTLLKERTVGSSDLAFEDGRLNVFMVVGVNGGGKTTTIGKLASKFVSEGAKVNLAAGDTFRAAACEQLAAWAERSGAEMCPYETGMKPSTVLYKAVEYASRKGDRADILITDTSGRLHTNSNLMVCFPLLTPAFCSELILTPSATIWENAPTFVHVYQVAQSTTRPPSEVRHSLQTML